jgi:uncharacterized repeat protein (TIGR01451 family)
MGFIDSGRRRSTIAALAALLGLTGSLLVAAPAIAADYDPVEVYLSKDASTDLVTPGQNFTYSFQVGCTSLTDACVDLVITDTIPAPFQLLAVSNTSTGDNAASATIDRDGNDITVTFTDDLENDDGSQGMLPSNYFSFVASVTLPADVSAEYDGDTVVNTAYVSVANPNTGDTEASAAVDLSVPLLLNSGVSKTYSPTSLSAIEGGAVSMALGATNTSNSPVDTITIEDPSSMPSNAFTYVAVSGATVTTWPSGADLVATDWFDGTQWQPGAAESAIVLPADPSLVQGLRFTFSSSTGRIDQGASALVTVDGALRASVEDIVGSATVTNTASSWLTLDGDEQPSRPAVTRTLSLTEVTVSPIASKTITPATVIGGEPVVVELRARNGGEFTLGSMTITEPATGSASFADQGIAFVGFVDEDIEWPVGATGGTISYWYEGESDFDAPITAETNALPAPEEGRIVVAFRVVFTGSMLPNQYAVLPFDATTSTVETDTFTLNTVGLEVLTAGGLGASTSASDDLIRRTARINTTVDKLASPDTIYSVQGSSSVVSLPARVDPRPSGENPGGSTVGVDRLVITDTEDPATDPFWEYFDLTAIVATSVPSGATMTVEFWDGDSWEPFDGPIVGPVSYSRTLTSGERAEVGGVRFTFTATADGAVLQPGASFQPNLRVSLRDTLRSAPELPAADPDAADTVVVPNTVISEVFSGTAVIGRAEDTAQITYSLLPVPGSGGGGGGSIPLIDKQWDTVGDTGLTYVNARSGDEATLRLQWGTGGLSFESVEILDPSDPTGSVAGTVFEAFDLVRIPEITSGMDALLTYDQITAVQLYYDGDWHDAPVCEDGACDGEFPGYTLTDEEREKTIGVRFLVEESPTRASRISSSDPLAPPVGSGVADTISRDREIALVFEVRDVRRSDAGIPVLGSTRGALYNAGADAPGQVINTATAIGTPVEGETRSSWASDSILILDTPIAVGASKTWTGGPLGTPPAGTPAELYPSARMTLSAENLSEAIRVDSLRLVEPSPGLATNPFDYVALTDIVSIDAPDGADVTVILQPSGDEYTVSGALGLGRAALSSVTGIEVVAEGRIATDERIDLVVDTQLRETLLGTSTDIRDLELPIELTNEVTATVTDLGGIEVVPPGEDNVVNAYASALLDIEYLEYGVEATKSITAGTVSTGDVPAIQYEDTTSATVRITAQPTGNVRSTRMVYEDSDPTFWNAFDFASFAGFSFAAPIDTVQVDALVGVDYVVGSGNSLTASCPEVDEDCWVTGVPGTALELPDGVDPEDVRGLRFTFTRSDYSAWERPFNPLQTVRFVVERREYLVEPADQLVPSTLFTFTEPVPGEESIATFTNTIDVDAAAARDADDTAPLWAATDGDTAAVTVQHLPARIEVTKSELGPRSLGIDIPFEITVTNIGDDRGAGDHDSTLTGLTVVENIPLITSGTNTGKPMLVIPNDPDTGLPFAPEDAFTYTLVSPGGAEQTVTNVTATLDSPTDTTEITFDYAGDLELGWSLVVHATMQFRPLLQAGTMATNTVDVTADQPFDQCFSTENGTIVTETNDVFTCNASTTVYPLPSSPLSITKSVRGVGAGPLDSEGVPTADDLGILRTTGTANCATNTLEVPGLSDVFYRYPCVPITRPGATEEWGTRLYNGGNIDVKKIVAIDVLPRVDDLGVIINASRDSKWTATLTTYPTVTLLPAGWDYEVYYTDEVGVASPRCNATDIQSTMGVPAGDPTIANPACLEPSDPDYVGDRPWMLLDPAADEATLATVVAFKIVIFATESAPLGLEPGQAVGLVYRTTTAFVPEKPEANDRLYRDSVAYNSLAAAAVGTLDDNDLPYRFVVEPRKVGVALAMGEIELRKDVTGAAASYATDSFELAVSCTTPDGDPIPLVYADGTQRSPYTVAEGSALLVPGIPLYSECSVSEARDYGQSNVPGPQTVVAQSAQAASASTVVLEKPPFAERVDTEVALLTNEYPAADLEITKSVETNGAVDEDGTPIEYLSALVSATCTFDNGTGPTTVWSITNQPVTPTSSISKTGLPAGTTCTVTETNQRGATTTSTVTTSAGSIDDDATPAAFELTEGENSVAFANDFGVGSLSVTKALAGLAKDEDWAQGPFTVRVVCTNLNATSTTVFDDTFELSPLSPTALIENLATGSSCAITEPQANGATSTALPSNVTITRSESTATVTNTFDYARLTVSKTVSTSAVNGSGTATRPGPFSFSVVCTFTHGGATDTIIADGFSASPMTFSLSHGGSQALTGMPAGTSCTVTEDTPVGSPTTTMRTTTSASGPSTVTALSTTIGPLTKDTNPTTGTNTVLVTNTYPVGTLRVTKSLQGGASTQFGTGPFEFTITCTQPGMVATYTKNISISGAASTNVANILAGSVCSVVETNAATTGADATVILNNSGVEFDGTGVTVVGSATRTVTFQNWYLTGQVTVSKAVTGPGAAFGTGPFTVNLECTRDGESIAIAGGANRSLTNGSSTTYTLLPSGASCTLTEPGAYGAASVAIEDAEGTLGEDGSFTFVVDVDVESLTDNQAQPAIAVTNDFDLASLTVSKSVVSGAENEDGDLIAYGDYSIQVTCTFQGSPVRADGFASNTMAFTLSDDTSRTLNGLPAGAICQVTETDDRGAARTSIQTVSGNGAPGTTEASTASVTLAADAEGLSTNFAAITNTFDSGSIELSKVVTGAAREEFGTGQFTVDVECVLVDGESSQVVWSGSYPFTDGSAPVTLSPIAAGADCTITESETAGATSTTVTVGSTATDGTTAVATVPAGTLAVVVTNVFDYASVFVEKTVVSSAVDQDGAPVYPGGLFAVEVECSFLGATVIATEFDESPMAFSLGHIGAITLTGLPAGSECEIRETDSVGADSTTIATSTVESSESVDGTTATIGWLTSDDAEGLSTNSAAITNRYGVGSFTVAKVLEGGAAAQYGTGPFDIQVTCIAPGDVVAFDDVVTLPIGDAWFRTIESIPVGSVCGIEESNFAETGADAVFVVDSEGEPAASATVGLDDPGYLAIANYYLTGSVEVTKSVTGLGERYGAGPFEVTLECVRDGVTATLPGATRSFVDGETVTFTGLPSGASCTLTESDIAGAASTSISVDGSEVSADAADDGYTFTVAVVTDGLEDDQPQPAITVANDFPLAGLDVSKVVTTTALVDGESTVSYGPFEVSVECTFLGEPVWADGYDEETPMLAELEAGAAPWQLRGLPTGAECAIEETETMDADGTSISVTSSGATDEIDGALATVILSADSGATATNSAVITNTYESGSLVLSKRVWGDGEEAWGTTDFAIEVICTLTDASGTRPILGATYPFTADSEPVTIDNLPAGALCQIEETATGAATATSITVGDADPTAGVTAEATIIDGELTVEVANRFDVTSIEVDKSITGLGGEAWGQNDFQVTLVCARDVDGETEEIEIPGGATRDLVAPDYSAEYSGLPVGADCAMTESRFGGANGSSVSPNVFELGATATEVSVTNEFTLGDLRVTKVVEGDGVGVEDWGFGPFEVVLECSRVINGETVAVEIPGGATQALTSENDYIALYSGLPAGATCSLEETVDGEATGTAIEPGAIAIAADETVDVTVTNTFTIGQLEIVKTASQPIVQGADSFDYTFEVTNVGTVPAAGITVVDDIPGELRVTGIAAEGWSECAVDGKSDLGYGGTLTCVYDETLAPGAEADAFTVTVEVLPDIAVDDILNVAVVTSTTRGVEGDDDDESVLVKWLDATVASECVLDAPWFTYSIDAHNVDTAGQTLTVTWRDGADRVIRTDEIPLDGGPVSGELLWPGAEVDDDGVGVMWPGYRVARAGETPTFENLILDPAVATYGLRSTTNITLSINPETTVSVEYPPQTEDCTVVREPGLWVEKTASAAIVPAGGEFDYTLTVGNDGLGAVSDLTLVDEVPSQLSVVSVTPLDPATDTDPAWERCEVSDRLANGAGGIVTCTLDRDLGWGQTVPDVVLGVRLEATASPGTIENVVFVTATSVDNEVVLEAEAAALIATPGMLALTGATLPIFLVPMALGLIVLGGVVVVVRSRRQKTS